MRGTEPIKDYYSEGKLLRGYSMTRLYGIWVGIKTRCYNPHDKKFSSYGGKGVLMCEEWKESFLPFAIWSMNNGYSEELSIDREDVNKGYSPENCRWVTMTVQQNNRSNNHRVTHNGETHTFMEWSRICGVKDTTIRERLKKGWSFEEAITRPVISFSEAGRIGCKKRWSK